MITSIGSTSVIRSYRFPVSWPKRRLGGGLAAVAADGGRLDRTLADGNRRRARCVPADGSSPLDGVGLCRDDEYGERED
jgi:hypothetical protein